MTEEPRAHARLSPSGSKIWMACPGSPTLCEGIESESSADADRGTQAHKVLELCLNNGYEPQEFVGSVIHDTPTFNQEDADAVKMAVDWIREDYDEAKGDEAEVEVRLRYNDDFWGTSDYVRYRALDRELLVVDYKHGSGVMVDAIGNPQGVSYALMKLKSLGNRGVSQVRFVIIQPRGFHEDGPIREFVVHGVDMLDWEDTITAAIDATQDARAALDAAFGDITDPGWMDAYVKSGSHCRWCNAAGICPRLKNDAVSALQTDFGPASEAAPEKRRYDVKQLAQSLNLVARVKAWASAVESFAYTEAERGVKIPGFKLVQKRASAKWRDPNEVQEAMDLMGLEQADIFEPAELKSPAQLRETLEPLMPGKTKKARTEAAKKELDKYTDYVSSGHTLVTEDVPRKPIKSDAADDFDAVA